MPENQLFDKNRGKIAGAQGLKQQRLKQQGLKQMTALGFFGFKVAFVVFVGRKRMGYALNHLDAKCAKGRNFVWIVRQQPYFA